MERSFKFLCNTSIALTMVEYKTDFNLTYSSDSSDFGVLCCLTCRAGPCAHRKRHTHTLPHQSRNSHHVSRGDFTLLYVSAGCMALANARCHIISKHSI